MKVPDLTLSLKKVYGDIARQQGLQEALAQLSGERALIAAAERQGRLTQKTVREMWETYDEVEASLK